MPLKIQKCRNPSEIILYKSLIITFKLIYNNGFIVDKRKKTDRLCTQ